MLCGVTSPNSIFDLQQIKYPNEMTEGGGFGVAQIIRKTKKDRDRKCFYLDVFSSGNIGEQFKREN